MKICLARTAGGGGALGGTHTHNTKSGWCSNNSRKGTPRHFFSEKSRILNKNDKSQNSSKSRKRI